MYFIYVVENLINGKMYVGKTTRLSKREREHASAKTNCRLLEKAVRKYGWENFDFSILERCDSQDDMDFKEKYWIREINTLVPDGYNLTEGGEGGGIPSNDTRKKMSASAKVKIFTEEHRQNIGNAVRGAKNGNYGKPVVGEHLKKLSESHKRENLSEETLKRMRISHSGKVLSEEHKKKISDALRGENNTRYGVSLSSDLKKKISDSLKKPFCGRGHSMEDPSNVYVKPNGRRRCRECSRIYDRKAYKIER